MLLRGHGYEGGDIAAGWLLSSPVRVFKSRIRSPRWPGGRSTAPGHCGSLTGAFETRLPLYCCRLHLTLGDGEGGSNRVLGHSLPKKLAGLDRLAHLTAASKRTPCHRGLRLRGARATPGRQERTSVSQSPSPKALPVMVLFSATQLAVCLTARQRHTTVSTKEAAT
jgi:hypothetical protein